MRGEVVHDPSHMLPGTLFKPLSRKALLCGWIIFPNPSPTKWGRIKEGAKRVNLTGKSGRGFCYPPLNPLPHGGRGGGR